MKKLYTHENRMILYNVRNLLLGEGIETLVINEFAGGGVGDLAAFETWPELWIEDDTGFAEADAILQGILRHDDDSYWICRDCQEKNDASFQLCWKCGRAID